MTGHILVAGVGNLFLGDDGFGPEVVRTVVAPGQEALPDGVRVVDYGIRGIHLAYDLLDGYDALVIVDALPFHGPPGELRLIEVGPDDVGTGDLDAHGMAPVAVLAGLHAFGEALPPTYILGCRPASVADGIGLSPPVQAALPGALALLRRVVVDLATTPVVTGRR